jgi:hypothetical protein
MDNNLKEEGIGKESEFTLRRGALAAQERTLFDRNPAKRMVGVEYSPAGSPLTTNEGALPCCLQFKKRTAQHTLQRLNACKNGEIKVARINATHRREVRLTKLAKV